MNTCKKTFARSKGERSFDWNKFLNGATKKRPSDRVCERVNGLAGAWVTCACGNQCERIPRDWLGAPTDGLLYNLGGSFCDEICFGDWKAAKKTLASIEKRSSQILAQLDKWQAKAEKTK